MAWLQSHQTLARHPKTLRAAKLLGVSVPAVIGHLHLLWWWCLDYADDGDVSGLNPEEISDIALWEGDSEAFVTALLSAGGSGKTGFLERSEDGSLLIHDWADYAGILIERRRRNAQYKKDIRRTSEGHPKDIPIVSEAREDKSREDKSREDKSRERSASASPSLPAFEIPDDFQPLTSLPGYKPKNYEKAFANVRAACADANVDVGAVVKQFASDYQTLRHDYAWTDPVAVLKKRPLAIAISKVLEGRSNGRSNTDIPGNRPAGAFADLA